jgi:hypothetical protein
VRGAGWRKWRSKLVVSAATMTTKAIKPAMANSANLGCTAVLSRVLIIRSEVWWPEISQHNYMQHKTIVCQGCCRHCIPVMLSR